jgi:hypothetical protein
MKCNRMMFGAKVRYCVTYKSNQRSFNVYSRKYYHDFKVPIGGKNLEGAIGLDISGMNTFLIAMNDKV